MLLRPPSASYVAHPQGNLVRRRRPLLWAFSSLVLFQDIVSLIICELPDRVAFAFALLVDRRGRTLGVKTPEKSDWVSFLSY